MDEALLRKILSIIVEIVTELQCQFSLSTHFTFVSTKGQRPLTLAVIGLFYHKCLEGFGIDFGQWCFHRSRECSSVVLTSDFRVNFQIASPEECFFCIVQSCEFQNLFSAVIHLSHTAMIPNIGTSLITWRCHSQLNIFIFCSFSEL